ncbi:MAG: anti-sigma factor [Tenacibaculum sp.]
MRKLILSLFAIIALSFASCVEKKEETLTPPTPPTPPSTLTLKIDKLPALGNDYVYEGWLIVDSIPVSTGTFSVDNNNELSQTVFEINDSTTLNSAKTFVLSIEPASDNDPKPSKTKILSGNFDDNSASLSVSEFVGDFSNVSGKFILATPTSESDEDETSGVWFLDNSDGEFKAGLTLPKLKEGWKYEGWAIIDGTPLSTGTFLSVTGKDDNASTSPFKGDKSDGPEFPGEDYIKSAPDSLNFPTDLRGSMVAISVEPDPDNSETAFDIVPLFYAIPKDAEPGKVLEMEKQTISITGTATRS